MPKKFICTIPTEELKDLYLNQNKTIKELCTIVGCKSDITMAKILKERGIDTNSNARLALKKRKGMSDDDFCSWLIYEYNVNRRSMNSIAEELGISQAIVKRYLTKYKIPVRTKSEQQTAENSATWKGGRRIASNGYVELKKPYYPHLNKRGYVYEHIFVAESLILHRPLKSDEVVHHINRNKTDNRVENLLVLTKSEHTKLHIKAKEFGAIKKEGD